METSVLFEDEGRRITGLQRLGGSVDAPLIVAIHGGGCTSRYFDTAGYSLLDRAAAQGHSIIALDRPGYGGSTRPPEGEETLANNAAALNKALAGIWARHQGEASGIFLIGHSIGAAITLLIAAGRRDWPLSGVAISGVMGTLAPAAAAAWSRLPETGWVERPAEVRDALGFGDQGSYAPEAQAAARVANAPSACREGRDIAFEWPKHFAEATAAIDVPVHFRIGARDALWVASDAELDRFAASFTQAPVVDAAIIPQVGHFIDFHKIGPQFQDEQLAFARRFA